MTVRAVVTQNPCGATAATLTPVLSLIIWGGDAAGLNIPAWAAVLIAGTLISTLLAFGRGGLVGLWRLLMYGRGG